MEDSSGNTEKVYLGPPTLFLHTFPPIFEDFFRNFDNLFIRLVQTLYFKPMKYLDLGLTFFTSIEFGCAVPCILLFMGFDSLALELMWLMFIVCFLSQIPKRLIWRPRPFMMKRARCLEETKTSSFPSRAVTCAVVYCYGVLRYLNLYGNENVKIGFWLTFFACTCFFFAASWARVQLGVHYPSDCLMGAVLGMFSILFSSMISDIHKIMCLDCLHSCYSLHGSTNVIETMQDLNWNAVIMITLAGIGLTLWSVTPPVRFWFKCHCVYGMVFPCMAFLFSGLCPPLAPSFSSLPKHNINGEFDVKDAVFGIFVGVITTVFGMISGQKIKDPFASTVIVKTTPTNAALARMRTHKMGWGYHQLIKLLENNGAEVVSKKKITKHPILKGLALFLVMHIFIFGMLCLWRFKKIQSFFKNVFTL
eukprot:TRINITY_DN1980_c0_g1_i1.p1 TRINITY_DN1980_c0_g1~~TRINITY_DN1980_c0_g1_i1.p1  ORF type:complete len:420 (+),score=81.59 TRINITY_DN1980_c0_g1_i1:870-2129(+)